MTLMRQWSGSLLRSFVCVPSSKEEISDSPTSKHRRLQIVLYQIWDRDAHGQQVSPTLPCQAALDLVAMPLPAADPVWGCASQVYLLL